MCANHPPVSLLHSPTVHDTASYIYIGETVVTLSEVTNESKLPFGGRVSLFVHDNIFSATNSKGVHCAKLAFGIPFLFPGVSSVTLIIMIHIMHVWSRSCVLTVEWQGHWHLVGGHLKVSSCSVLTDGLQP